MAFNPDAIVPGRYYLMNSGQVRKVVEVTRDEILYQAWADGRWGSTLSAAIAVFARDAASATSRP